MTTYSKSILYLAKKYNLTPKSLYYYLIKENLDFKEALLLAKPAKQIIKPSLGTTTETLEDTLNNLKFETKREINKIKQEIKERENKNMDNSSIFNRKIEKITWIITNTRGKVEEIDNLKQYAKEKAWDYSEALKHSRKNLKYRGCMIKRKNN